MYIIMNLMRFILYLFSIYVTNSNELFNSINLQKINKLITAVTSWSSHQLLPFGHLKSIIRFLFNHNKNNLNKSVLDVQSFQPKQDLFMISAGKLNLVDDVHYFLCM